MRGEFIVEQIEGNHLKLESGFIWIDKFCLVDKTYQSLLKLFILKYVSISNPTGQQYFIDASRNMDTLANQ